jgi:hypothetical protein
LQQAADELARGERGHEKRTPDCQADAAAAEQLLEPPPRSYAPAGEELAHCVAEKRGLLGQALRTVKMNEQRERRVAGQLACPTHDVLRDGWIEIPIVKR